MLRRVALMSCLSLLHCPGPLPSWAGAAEKPFVAFMENSSTLTVIHDGEQYLDLNLVAWGPNWSWAGFSGETATRDGATVFTNTAKIGDARAAVSLNGDVRQTGSRQLSLRLRLQATADVPLTYVVAALQPAGSVFKSGQVVAQSSDGSAHTVRFPLDKQGLGRSVREFAMEDAQGLVTRVTFDRPCDIPSDDAVRIVLAADQLRQSQPVALTLGIELPHDVSFFAGPEDMPSDPSFADWYEFKPDENAAGESYLSMEDWLERPAGKHGRIVSDSDRLVYNSKPLKLWGLNLCYSACAPEKELADKRAAFYARHGINAVRLHKYGDGPGWAGIQSRDSFTQFDPEGLDRMDYFVAQLKQHGIYVKLSAHFGAQKLGPADKQHVPYLEEFGSFSGRNDRITTPHSAVHYAPELQTLQIQQMVNLLQHVNPYTGLKYADDPAIAFVEIINEQSILFYTSMGPLKASPTLRKYVAQRFCDWLREKYGTHEKLEAAWGGQAAFDSFTGDGFPAVGEHLDKHNILPLGNPWYWDPVQLAGSQKFRQRRLLDTLQFLYGLQNEFYARYVQAMREAGYLGEIVSSNWQAGRALSHCFNLHSDALVGTVDRHNYFGGGQGSRIDSATMLSVPGSGMLSSGMQQVSDRPFMLSEWIHVTPTEWGVEGPAILGAYGMGLQGWDVSFIFQNRDSGSFSERIGRDRWDATAPQVLGVFPAVSRQVLRGDVTESPIVAPCYVHVPSLGEGKIGFQDQVKQQYDVKTFGTDKVPAESLAAVRCVVEFTDEYRETPALAPGEFLQSGTYVSCTKQLRWTPGSSKLDGHFTIDTAATKAIVGFADGQSCKLGEVAIEPKCRFAAIYVTAREPDRDLASSSQWLVVAIARARNQGMQVFNDDRIISRGGPPIVMEPVKAGIRIAKQGATVYPLDHNGRKTDRTLPFRDGQFEIDGARDQTCYYLVSFGPVTESVPRSGN